MPRRATKRGEERTAAGTRLRRPDLRGQLCRPGGGPRAGRKRRRRAGHRSLRDRRAADVGVRNSDRLARGDGAARSRLSRSSASWSSTPRTRPSVTTFRGRSRPSTTALCAGCWPTRARSSSRPRRSTVEPAHTVRTDRGEIRAPLIVDALGWRRVLGAGANIQPPDALLSRGLEVHPFGSGHDLEVWIDRSYVPAGYGWSFPADGELRIGVGSFDPRFHVREPTERLARDLAADRVRYQGNWIPHALRDATEDGVFFAGDSAGHCLPADGRGNPHGTVLRPRLRARAPSRRRRTAVAGPGAGALPRVLGQPFAALPLVAEGPAPGASGGTAPARPGPADDGTASGSSTGRSATIWASPTRTSSPRAARRRWPWCKGRAGLRPRGPWGGYRRIRIFRAANTHSASRSLVRSTTR